MYKYKNKIINMDFFKTHSKRMDPFYYKTHSSYDPISLNSRYIEFNNCIFIQYENKSYMFSHCTFVNCTFYHPKQISMYYCNIQNILIIDNNDQKMPMNIHVKESKIYSNPNGITFDSCLINDCELSGTVNHKSSVSFVNCINEPRFYMSKKPFYGYKYSNEGYLIILEIPEGAVVYESSDEYNKCRTHKAKVVSILNTNGTYSGIRECRSWYDEDFKYTTGEGIIKSISPEYRSCTKGIHFFKTLKDAYIFWYYKMMK